MSAKHFQMFAIFDVVRPDGRPGAEGAACNFETEAVNAYDLWIP